MMRRSGTPLRDDFLTVGFPTVKGHHVKN